jgi:hypothetical protein
MSTLVLNLVEVVFVTNANTPTVPPAATVDGLTLIVILTSDVCAFAAVKADIIIKKPSATTALLM